MPWSITVTGRGDVALGRAAGRRTPCPAAASASIHAGDSGAARSRARRLLADGGGDRAAGGAGDVAQARLGRRLRARERRHHHRRQPHRRTHHRRRARSCARLLAGHRSLLGRARPCSAASVTSIARGAEECDGLLRSAASPAPGERSHRRLRDGVPVEATSRSSRRGLGLRAPPVLGRRLRGPRRSALGARWRLRVEGRDARRRRERRRCRALGAAPRRGCVLAAGLGGGTSGATGGAAEASTARTTGSGRGGDLLAVLAQRERRWRAPTSSSAATRRRLRRPLRLVVAAQPRHALPHARRRHVRLRGDRLELLALPLAQHPLERLLVLLALGQLLARPAHQVHRARGRALGGAPRPRRASRSRGTSRRMRRNQSTTLCRQMPYTQRTMSSSSSGCCSACERVGERGLHDVLDLASSGTRARTKWDSAVVSVGSVSSGDEAGGGHVHGIIPLPGTSRGAAESVTRDSLSIAPMARAEGGRPPARHAHLRVPLRRARARGAAHARAAARRRGARARSRTRGCSGSARAAPASAAPRGADGVHPAEVLVALGLGQGGDDRFPLTRARRSCRRSRSTSACPSSTSTR